ALVAVPVLAQGGLPHFAPRQAENLPPAPRKLDPRPAAPRFLPVEEVEKRVGFSLIVPSYLPSGCTMQERFYGNYERVAHLNYSCVGIEERKGDSVLRPYVGEGPIQTLTIKGQDALYFGGAWVKVTGAEEPTWMPGVAHELVLESNGLVIRLTASSVQLTKEELIKIAESMM